MAPFLWNIVLALVWAFSWGELSLDNVLIGAVAGYAILWLAADLVHARKYCENVPRIFAFIAIFAWELLIANLRIAYDVIAPRFRMRPGIIAFPLDTRTDGEITLLANLISLTPGTLSVDVSADRSKLFIHMQFIDDPEKAKQRLKQGLERRLLRLLR